MERRDGWRWVERRRELFESGTGWSAGHFPIWSLPGPWLSKYWLLLLLFHFELLSTSFSRQLTILSRRSMVINKWRPHVLEASWNNNLAMYFWIHTVSVPVEVQHMLDSVKSTYIMYTEGTRDLYHRRNRLFRRPKHIAQGRLIRFPRWSKSRMLRRFHRIMYLYYTSLFVCLSVTTNYCSRVLEAYKNRQDCRYWRPVNILRQHVIWMITFVITPLLCYFAVAV